MQTHVKQLLRARLFPATVTDPKTAATFNVLEQYHKLSFESKASAFEFYHSLARLSDNIGIDPPKVSNLLNSHLLQDLIEALGPLPNLLTCSP